MPQCVVIADDLTGANAVGVLVAKENLRTYAVMSEEMLNLSALNDCDCLVYPTDSRSADPEIAYSRVFNAVRALKSPDVKMYSKRVDSTLRGNLGCETDAVLDALDNGVVAIVVPCFPESKRVTIGGLLIVNGLPLHKTEAAVDPKNPISTPLCADLFRQQSKYPVDSICLGEQMKGPGYVAGRIRELAARGVRIVIFDAVTQEDIELIADAVIQSGVAFIAVDPGVFTAVISRKLITPRHTLEKKRILLVLGSVKTVTGVQAEFLLASHDILNIYMAPSEFLESEQRRSAEIERVATGIIEGCEDYELCSVIGKGIFPEHRINFESYSKHGSFEELSTRINDAVAEITYRIISSGKGFEGLYTCGGDITTAICRRMKNTGLKLLDEVLPLAAYGEFVGGPHEGLKVVTKGGLVGETDSLVRCVKYLREKITT